MSKFQSVDRADWSSDPSSRAMVRSKSTLAGNLPRGLVMSAKVWYRPKRQPKYDFGAKGNLGTQMSPLVPNANLGPWFEVFWDWESPLVPNDIGLGVPRLGGPYSQIVFIVPGALYYMGIKSTPKASAVCGYVQCYAPSTVMYIVCMHLWAIQNCQCLPRVVTYIYGGQSESSVIDSIPSVIDSSKLG